MNNEAIEIMTKLYIKEHFKGDKSKYIISKEELIKFCIKLVKEIERYNKC